MLIDTHAHLNFPDYEKDLDKVVARAIKAGVKKIICVSSNITDSKKAIEIAKKHPKIVFAAVGIHPHQTDPENQTPVEEQIKKLEKLAKQKEVVAIGECGLDFSPAPPKEKERPRSVQQFLFESQIKLAQKLNLPLLIHSREAFKETVEILKKFKGLKGVFHCYAGGKKGIPKVEELGFFFGLAGNLTYDEGLQNVLRQIPLEKIVLETDSPFLAPVPFRGQRNEPAHIKIIAQALAKIKNISFEKVAKTTTKNTHNLFLW
ncbi:MAG: TatD family hydrolase [Microgenomates group bacterium]